MLGDGAALQSETSDKSLAHIAARVPCEILAALKAVGLSRRVLVASSVMGLTFCRITHLWRTAGFATLPHLNKVCLPASEVVGTIRGRVGGRFIL